MTSLAKTILMIIVFCAATLTSSAQITFTTLVNFSVSTGGVGQYMSLVQGPDGNLYGTTEVGGPSIPFGTVFNMTPTGTLTILHTFAGVPADGAYPEAGLVLGTDGNLYGATIGGGDTACGLGCGTFFRVTPGGTLTTLQSWNGYNGTQPGWLIQASDGNFYGATQFGADTACSPDGCGTIFKITPSGTLTTLHAFLGTDGSDSIGALVQASNSGYFYGTTNSGGAYGWGTVFQVTPGGTVTTLHSFDYTDGALPRAALIQASDGNFYGTTSLGGTTCSYPGCGTLFKITPSGTLTTLHGFDGTDGSDSLGALVQASDGNLYGTTAVGGASGYGTIFQFTLAGTLTTMYNFCSQSGCTDGENPVGLVQATNGSFYGPTEAGGSGGGCVGGCGTVFSLSVGLGPFVETVPATGKVGSAVTILGQNLTGASSVTFNGTTAAFTVQSATEITTTVPSGATTGFVTVTTPSGVFNSNVVFRVR